MPAAPVAKADRDVADQRRRSRCGRSTEDTASRLARGWVLARLSISGACGASASPRNLRPKPGTRNSAQAVVERLCADSTTLSKRDQLGAAEERNLLPAWQCGDEDVCDAIVIMGS